jgi:hypothetical protein
MIFNSSFLQEFGFDILIIIINHQIYEWLGIILARDHFSKQD